ncbi:MAG: amidase [Pseudomonadota bacterium]
MKIQELPFLTMGQTAKLVRKKAVSPEELVRAYLRRIEAVDGKLHSYITVCSDEAMNAARQAQKDIAGGIYRGPLHGVPIAVKDQMCTKGIRTTSGSKIFKDYIPDEDATVIRKLKDAGAILLGKLNLSEFAVGGTRVHPYGTPRNPWNLECNPGESSSGSGIAVSASLCAAALGEDTGGSIRWPAAWCGVVGLRPTSGRVSRYGIAPLCWSMDTAGPMTRTVEDCALLLQAIAGYDPRDGTSLQVPVPDYASRLSGDLKGMRLGYVREYLNGEVNDKDVQEAVEKAIETFGELGAQVEEVSIPLLSLATPIFLCTADVDFAHVLEDILRTRAQDVDSHTRTRCFAALLIPPYLYHRGQRARRLLRDQILGALCRVNALISPTGPKPPQKISSLIQRPTSKEDVLRVMFRSRSYMSAYALAALPAISIPCGFTASNLPIGLQIAGRPFEEATVLRVASAFESATEYHLRRPPLD